LKGHPAHNSSLVGKAIPFGYSMINCSKDARLPVQLQRAMAAEAEAAREARAKVYSTLLRTIRHRMILK
jgi:hypothetical protein